MVVFSSGLWIRVLPVSGTHIWSEPKDQEAVNVRIRIKSGVFLYPRLHLLLVANSEQKGEAAHQLTSSFLSIILLLILLLAREAETFQVISVLLAISKPTLAFSSLIANSRILYPSHTHLPLSDKNWGQCLGKYPCLLQFGNCEFCSLARISCEYW